MTELTKQSPGDLVSFTPPAELGARIAASEARAKYEGRRGEEEACRRFTRQALESRARSYLEYKARFPHGNFAKSESTDTVDSLRDDWLREIGVSDQTVRRWHRYTDDATLESQTEVQSARLIKIFDAQTAANYSSETNEWYTPAVYVEAVRELYGGAIDLDPATSAKANETVRASQIFTIGDDALTKDWHGNAFLNPPYGTDKGESVAGRFCNKAIAEYEAGRLEQCVILVNSVHSQKWQKPLYAFPVCFVDHRISFVNAEGEGNENPTFQNVFVYLGPDRDAFAQAFNAFGYVMVPT